MTPNLEELGDLEQILSDNFKVPINLNGTIEEIRRDIENACQACKDFLNKDIEGYDEITGLISQREFEIQIKKTVEEYPNLDMSIIILSLDGINIFMDTDERNDILKKLSNIISSNLRTSSVDVNDCEKKLLRKNLDIITGILLGDLFGMSIFGVDIKNGETIANRLQKVIGSTNFGTEESPIYFSTSIGIVEYDKKLDTKANINLCFDSVQKATNLGGEDKIVIGDYLENEYRFIREILEKALIGKDYEFKLYCQRIVSSSGNDNGDYYEVLLRLLEKKTGKITSPGKFIEIAEILKILPRIDRWVVEQTFKWLSENIEHLEQLGTCSVNLSGDSLSSKITADFIEDMFEKYNIPPEKICFEITETGVVSDLVIAKSNKNRIKSLGCCIAIDDYGVGNSSLEKLNDETYDRVKLDGSLITGLIIDGKVDEVKLAIIEKTCDVAKLLGIKVIAEFVNGKDVKKILKEVGVQYFQGYESSGEPFLLNDILIRNEYR